MQPTTMKTKFFKTISCARLLAGLLGAATAAACGSSADATSTSGTTTTTAAASCDVSEQPSCPSVVPSYASSVKTIIATYCLECHDPNGIGAQTTGYGPGRPPAGQGNDTAHDANRPADPNGGFNSNSANWDPSTGRDWTKFSNITANRVSIMQQVFLCKMPPAAATPMDAADRKVFLQWLACGAPNN